MRNYTKEELAEMSWDEVCQVSANMCQERISDIVSKLFDELNKMGNEEMVSKFFIEAMCRQHRTLQQNFFSHVVVAAIKDFAKRHDEGYYDLRNEAACKCAKKLMPLIKDEHFPFI